MREEKEKERNVIKNTRYSWPRHAVATKEKGYNIIIYFISPGFYFFMRAIHP